jgi:monothiol glutaredoxin
MRGAVRPAGQRCEHISGGRGALSATAGAPLTAGSVGSRKQGRIQAAAGGPRGAGGQERAMSDIHQTIKETIETNRVVLFMKGTKTFPQCGFSARAVEILKKCGAEFKDVNVLADPAIRQGIKEFSSWPTIPQIYVDGKFVGGSDILMEMYASGDLQKLLDRQA